MQSNRDMPLIPRAAGADQTQVAQVAQSYLEFHDDSKGDNSQKRKEGYVDMINKYYDMVTDFYEWGWGQSFHFAIRYRGENFFSSIARSEHWLATQTQLKPGMKVLDVGCGVGGPAREIARFSGANVVGVNNNQYQIGRAQKHTRLAGLENQVEFVKSDFMHLPFPDNHFDAIYQIEATAHAPDKVACYSELFRVLKPGGLFGSYEWCLTDKYEHENAQHRKIKKGIEEGDSLPDIATTHEVVAALKKSGYEVVHEEDRCRKLAPCDVDWFDPLIGKLHPMHIHHTELGHQFSNLALRVLEKFRVVAPGSSQVEAFLHTAAVNLTLGGQLEIFTPSFFTLARKPDSQ